MLLLGTDPEFFIRKNGEFISGHIFKCGTKERPQKTPHGSVQVDGLALEVNSVPAGQKHEFIGNILSVMHDLRDIVDAVDKTAEIVAVPTAPFTKEFLDSLPPEVRELGCNPDYSAYTRNRNTPPDAERPFRTGSGHVHLGWTKDKVCPDAHRQIDNADREHFDYCCQMSKQLDYFLGLSSLDWDSDTTRRELYGAPGAFRPKPYGMEYRTLSNAWLTSVTLIETVWDRTQKAWEMAQRGYWLDDEYEGFAEYMIGKGIKDWRSEAPAGLLEFLK